MGGMGSAIWEEHARHVNFWLQVVAQTLHTVLSDELVSFIRSGRTVQ